MNSENNELYQEQESLIALPWILAVVLFLYLGYTTLQICNLVLMSNFSWQEPVVAILSLIPGTFGVLFLFLMGFTKEDCFLAIKKPSKIGTIFLILSFGSLAFTIPFGEWIGWNWLAGLLYAPLSAIAQELFFRATLLPVLVKMMGEKVKAIIPVLIHTLLFGIWHIGVFWLAPWWAALMVCFVPTLVGILWGWEAQNDKTIVYTIIVHGITLIIMSMFNF